MKNILVATDLSTRCTAAIRRAGLIAAATGAQVHILRVVEDNVPNELIGAVAKLSREQIARVLHEGAVPEGVRVEVDVLPGSPWQIISAQAAQISADLVIFGRHRQATGPFAMPGTVIERVLRTLHIPVLLVAAPPPSPYRAAIVGVDFSPHSRLALHQLDRIAPGASVHIVHGFHAIMGERFGGEAQRAEEKLHRRELEMLLQNELPVAKGGTLPNIIVAEAGPAVLIREVAARDKIDLVIVGSQGRAGFRRFVLGSVAEDLIADPPCDVLVVRAQ